ncbi:uncharacterized protein LOC127122340 [Lathyrus oleraceus]|uniref:uncharacterized protein LOC127122340 n=1 Tax=Pisum sativum TaxID=3888 RepID=UPI0021CE0083|nr:uncharacterized protein LOC127122340 [Pisum sativum]
MHTLCRTLKVAKNDFSFKEISHKFKLIFYGISSAKTADLPNISQNHMNLISFDDILAEKFQSEFLVGNLSVEILLVFICNKLDLVFAFFNGVGDLTSQFCNYYNNNNESNHVIVLLKNARIKEAEVEISLLSIFNLQVDITQYSQYSYLDNFTWITQVLSIVEINNLQYETTCVIVAKLDKFEVGQTGCFYDGRGECTKNVSLKDGNLKCFLNHERDENDKKYKARLAFWDDDCVNKIGKTVLELNIELIEVGEDNPLEYPYALDKMLK